MKINFVRHGKTQNDTVIGRINAPLIEDGVQEIQKLSEEIPTDYKEIYSSDQPKCKQTVEILNKKLNLPVKYDPRLRERDFGSLSGRRFNEIDPTGHLQKIDELQNYDYTQYGGESVEDVRKRVLDFIDDLRRDPHEHKILVVTHAGIIRLLKHDFEEISQHPKIYEFKLGLHFL